MKRNVGPFNLLHFGDLFSFSQYCPVVNTFFKDVQVNLSEVKMDDLISLKKFQEKLKALGHFYTPYTSIEDLNRQLKNQLDKILEEMR